MTLYEVQLEKSSLIKAGYSRLRHVNRKSTNVVAVWQKQFKDEHGVKYVVLGCEESNLFCMKPGEVPYVRFTYRVLLRDVKGNRPLGLEFSTDWTHEEVEAHIETLFSTGAWRYYNLSKVVQM